MKVYLKKPLRQYVQFYNDIYNASMKPHIDNTYSFTMIYNVIYNASIIHKNTFKKMHRKGGVKTQNEKEKYKK